MPSSHSGADGVERPEGAAVADKVRFTVDLAKEEHRQLCRWCEDAADALGLSSVRKVTVVRVLLRLLHADPELARRVRAELDKPSMQ